MDIGIYNYSSEVPLGHKMNINIRPTVTVINGVFSECKFTLRCLADLNIEFNLLNSAFGVQQFGGPFIHGEYAYYRFSNVLQDPPVIVNWAANVPVELVTLKVDCSASNASIELINDAFAQSIHGEYYQELNAVEETGIIYASTVITGPNPSLNIVFPPAVCTTVDLSQVLKGESPSGGNLSYHLSLADAEANTHLLTPSEISAAQGGTYGIRYSLPSSGCFVAAAVDVMTGNCVEVDAKVFLQGPYDALTSHNMSDDLRHISAVPVFPLQEPYGQYNTAAFNFAFIHVNGGGGESTTSAVLDVEDSDNAIVDWVFLELRHKNNPNQVVATRSALLQRDGDVVDTDGYSPVFFSRTEKDHYYLMIRHRNHLAVRSAALIDYTNGLPFTDFTDPGLATFGNTATSARIQLEPNVFGLRAGNTNLKQNGVNFQVIYNGSGNDRLPLLTLVGSDMPLNTVPGYYLQDVNLDGIVKYNGSKNDRLVILNNVGNDTPLNILTQEPP